MSEASSAIGGAAIVPLRRRADLIVSPSFTAPTQARLVKDPVALRYFELPEELHFLWRRLDGRTTWQELREQFERAFAPRQLSGPDLFRMLEDLHRRGLITSDRPGQGAMLRLRGERERRRNLLRRFANPLAICLPGIDPQPWLARLPIQLAAQTVRALFLVWGVLCLGAIVTSIVHFDTARRELAAAGSFADLTDGVLWIAAIMVAKVVHELAHAAACRRLGGECREIGLMLLCGLPCLYCDVSSMWMTPERWKRMAVSAAGMFAETLLAAVALLLWRFSEPGLLHALCLHLAIVCSVGTILINANPLLRYDGYFILSDALGIVNLGDRADGALRAWASQWFFGESAAEDSFRPEPRRYGLAIYALASTVYRWMLTLGVLWFVRRLLAQHGLTLISDLLTLVVVGSLTVPPLARLQRRWRYERRERRGAASRFVVRSLALACAAAAVLLWPWPHRVSAPAVAVLHDAEYLYVVAGGRLTEAVALGSQVQPGDRIAVLDDPPLRLETARLEADVARRRLEIEHLEKLRVSDPARADGLPAAREFLKAAEAQLRHLQREQQRLQIVAGRAGTVIPQLASHAATNSPTGSAAATATESSPLDPARRGAYWEPGTPLCAVGDPQRLEAQVAVDQHEIEFIRPGQTVELRFDAAPGRTFTGRIVETAEVEFDDRVEPSNQDRSTPGSDERQNTATRARYLARVVLDERVEDLPVGAVGRAKIGAEPQSLWTRLRRSLHSTFRFVWNAV